MRPLETILAHFPDARRSGKDWTARCPAHDDKKASLSLAEADDGRVLLNCFAGCKAEEIVEALGLEMSALFPTADRLPKPIKPRSNGRPTDETFPTAKAAVAALERQHGPIAASWTYHNIDGEPMGVTLRWNLSNGTKNIRPVSRHGGRWVIGGMAEPRPLYRLPKLAGADQVFVCEGEKCVDAAWSIGLAATTSAHGSKSAGKTDWQPLAGKDVILLPDNDDAGGAYDRTVASILLGLNPPATVRIVELPGLAEHGDIADWIDNQDDAAESDELRRQVEKLADAAPILSAVDLPDAAPAAEPERAAERVEPFRPFPVDTLSEPVRGFVRAGAKAIGCDTSYVALPMLTALAAAIGNSQRIGLKRGWPEPAVIWTAIVGESGTSKTPAMKLVLEPIRERQRRALQAHTEAIKRYEADAARWEKAMGQWKRDKAATDDPPAKPDPPQAERCVVSDTTVEALAPLLLANPRGLLLARDELAGWFGSFDRYVGKGKAGGDVAHWLSMFNAESLTVDRKTGPVKTIHVPRAAVSICGGIQPTILNRALATEHRQDGLAARLLLTCPPRRAKKWSKAIIDPELERQYAEIIDRLYQLKPAIDEDRNRQPVVLPLTPDAQRCWKRFYNAHNQEQVDLTGDLAAVWSKLECYAARLALVIHCTRWAARDPTLADRDKIDLVSMEAGVKLVEWFKYETRRIYGIFAESAKERDRRELMEWICGKGGSVTVREVQQGHRQYRTATDAEAALTDLVKAGLGRWKMDDHNGGQGRPVRVFKLSTASTSTQIV